MWDNISSFKWLPLPSDCPAVFYVILTLQMSCSEAVSDIFRAHFHSAAQVLGNESADGSSAVGRAPGFAGTPRLRTAGPPPQPARNAPNFALGASNRRHSNDSDILVRDHSVQPLGFPDDGGGGISGAGPSGRARPQTLAYSGGGDVSGDGPGGGGVGVGVGGGDDGGGGDVSGVTWSSSRRGDLGRGDSVSGHHRVGNGGAENHGEENARGVDDRERSTPQPGRIFDGANNHGGGGGGGSLAGEENNANIGGQGRALPMLWPPPRACTVLRDEKCQIPSQIVVRWKRWFAQEGRQREI